MVKRYFVGYGFLFALILVTGTLDLPFVLTLGKGIGFLPPEVLPIPRGVFVLSVVITLVVGLRWLWFPSQWIDTHLMQLRTNLFLSHKWLLLRGVGILIAIPLCAFLLSPYAILWIGLEEAAAHFHIMDKVVQFEFPIAMILGVLWLGVALSRLCPSNRKLRWLFLRCQTIFIDWAIEPNNPQAASEERERLHQCCKE